jgi:hypothetical protein
VSSAVCPRPIRGFIYASADLIEASQKDPTARKSVAVPAFLMLGKYQRLVATGKQAFSRRATHTANFSLLLIGPSSTM